MNRFFTIAFTHHTAGLDAIGTLHVEEDLQLLRMEQARKELGLSEAMMVLTCNRLEFHLIADFGPDPEFLKAFFQLVYPDRDEAFYGWAMESITVFQGNQAVEHLFRVTSSLDSLVVGEREIITQVRNAYERFLAAGTTGDFLRMVIRKAIETAKAVYTETEIANRPVSVVNLAFRQLQEKNLPLDSRVLVVGAGQTNKAMVRNLSKAGYVNVTVFNRTLSKAQELAQMVEGQAYPLDELREYAAGFDVLLTCTGSTEPVITKDIFSQLLKEDQETKTIVDLAVPHDVEHTIPEAYSIDWINVKGLRETAAQNLELRKKELVHCEVIIERALGEFDESLQARKVDLAMRAVPIKVKEIRQTAVEEVFAKEMDALDDDAREVVEKVLAYMEKKYISVPMKMARQIMLDRSAGR